MTDNKIGLLNHMGHGNLGNAATQDAIIINIRKRCPNAQIYGFSLNPDDTARRHNIPSYAIRKDSKEPPTASAMIDDTTSLKSRIKRKLKGYPFLKHLVRSAYHVAFTYPVELMQELVFLIESFKVIRTLDLLIISGGGELSDHWGGPRSFPYTILKWVVIARMAGVKVIFLNVGASPLHFGLSKLFVKCCLSLAHYRSVRDDKSKELINEIGFHGKIQVYPDSVYSLEYNGHSSMPLKEGTTMPVVGIHPMPYCDPRVWPRKDAPVYRRYICELASFGVWLLESGYKVNVFGSDIYHDSLAISDFMRTVVGSSTAYSKGQMTEESISGVEELLSKMALMDYVITPRFHGVIFSHILNKPVLAISHDLKVSTLMKDIGLSEYCVEIEEFKVVTLREKFNLLVKNHDHVKKLMSSVLDSYRDVLNQQSDELFLTCRF